MAHAFSVEIQNFLTSRIKQAEGKRTIACQQDDQETQNYYAGQLLELNKIRWFLTDNFDLKNHKYY